MFQNIFAELGRNRMTLTSLAETLGVNRKTVYKWMHGQSEIPASAIIKMAGLFNCTTDYLLGLKSQRAG